MPSIHELLDEAKRACEALVREMESFQSARSLHMKATEALDSTCEALKATAKAIEPLSHQRMRRMATLLLVMTGLNAVMFLATLLVIIVIR